MNEEVTKNMKIEQKQDHIFALSTLCCVGISNNIASLVNLLCVIFCFYVDVTVSGMVTAEVGLHSVAVLSKDTPM